MLRMMHWTGLLMVAGLVTGCAHLYDAHDEHMMKWKCCHEAKMAWLRCRDLYAEVAFPFDFGQGFRAGYESVCMGGDGCRPPMPPRNYWSHHYQCDDGRQQVMAWYDGYNHGSLAALCNGCAGRCNVLCAADLYGEQPCAMDYDNLEHRIVPEGEMLPGMTPLQVPYDMPYAPPPVPAAGEFADPYMPMGGDASMVPGAASGAAFVPALVPGAQLLNPGIDATHAPTF